MESKGHFNPSNPPPPQGPKLPEISVLERGAPKDGAPQEMDRRLFMQLLAYRVPTGSSAAAYVQTLCEALGKAHIGAVVYEDLNDPFGLAVLSFSEDPSDFTTLLRPLFGQEPLSSLLPRPELTMLGRTYSGGYEDDLQFWLLRRPVDTVTNASWPWAVWYPLRRTGAFAKLSRKEQAGILREHATIGRAYGEKDLAHDVRLACHGLDVADNEFVVGLVGKTLHPLSHVVQTMRSTRQTSEYIAKMGPFFVGRVVYAQTSEGPVG